MIQFENETVVSFKQAAEIVPGGAHYNTITKWADNGVKGIVLESIRVGRRRFTSKEAIQRFIEELTALDDQIAPVSRNTRRRPPDWAARELERRFGVKIER